MLITNCANMIKKKTMILEDRRSHRIEVPGETQLFVQVVGSEVITDGVMRCQGKSCHVNGHWLKNIVLDEQVRVHLTQENYVELNQKVQSERDQVKMECKVNQGGCINERTFGLW